MDRNVNQKQDAAAAAEQDGDSVRVAAEIVSPRHIVTTPVSVVLDRLKRSSISPLKSRHSDSDSPGKDRLCIDTAKSTDDSDGDSENRMVIQSDSEKDASASDQERESGQNGNSRSAAAKRKASDDQSDDEDFHGFTAEEQLLAKKSKSNIHGSGSPHASPKVKSGKAGKTENVADNAEKKSIPVVEAPTTPVATSALAEPTSNEKSGHIITRDPRFRNPFKHGWRREVVFRAHFDPHAKADNRGEVYYHTPNGKKLRTKAEILAHLPTDGTLDIADFTFAKEKIGMSPELEIVRNAKIQTPSQKGRAVNFLDLGSPDPALGFGKRTPKPKFPKGASPPPPIGSGKSKANASGQKRPLEAEIIQQKAPKISAKSGRNDVCSIQCVLAMGTIPQLQCKKCSAMYHYECVGREKFGAAISNYICKNCQEQDALTNQASQSQTPKSSSAKTVKDKHIAVPSTSAPKAHRNTHDTSRSKSHTTSSSSKTAGSTNSSRKDGSAGVSLISPSVKSNINNSSKNSPQSVAIVAGRTYIMVPKKSMDPLPSNITDGLPNGIVHSTKTSKSHKAPLVSESVLNSRTSHVVASDHSVHTLFASDFFNNISRGYDILLQTFQYLKVQELLRASRVCRMWNQAANNSLLWRTVRMKNSRVNDWSGLTNALKRHGTRHLDLRKILIPPNLNWSDFLENIGDVSELQGIDLCKCPPEAVIGLFERNRNLRILNAVSINGDVLSIPSSHKLLQLTELRLKAIDHLDIVSLEPLKLIKSLRHLSITSVVNFDESKFIAIQSLTGLESLELGECCEFSERFATEVLARLTNLRRLRLEKGQLNCKTLDILNTVAKLPKLSQLELVNFDVAFKGFEKCIGSCKHLKRLMLIPTYLSQSATTNHSILAGISKLKDTLKVFTWVVTQELLRVTDLYVEKKSRDRRQQDDKIPILKPVPLMTKDAAILKSVSENVVSEVPQVEIVPLTVVQVMVGQALPDLKLNILKVPFHATWRQTMAGTS